MDWSQARSLLEELLPLPQEQRAAWLASRVDDSGERARLLAMLAAEEAEPDYLEPPADPFDADEGRVQARVGPWRLSEPLGRGGMGVVWRAERAHGAFEQSVALKLVRAELGGAALERFELERRVLARLEHPGIARLVDGGTTETGRPYLAMELVEGTPIVRHADERALDLDGRLELMRRVCSAVQHAHASLVVHRDLKPSNVLVTPEGRPKLLDFGIAKLLDGGPQDPALTRTGGHLLTPDYCSPEQLRGEPVTTASDVYSLGVILYELLAGARPFELDTARWSEVERVVCQVEPPPVSQRARATGRPTDSRARRSSRDLDAIVAKALHKDPERRYPGAAALSDDLARWLAGRAVEARPDTIGYRARTFVRRNRLLVGAVLAVVISLALGLAFSTQQFLRARRLALAEGAARAEAQRRFEDVRSLATTFVFDVHDELRGLQGTLSVRERIIERAAAELETLARDAGDDPRLAFELAAALLRLGDVQGHPGSSNLGRSRDAEASFQHALALLGERDEPAVNALRTELRFHLADVYLERRDAARAVELYREVFGTLVGAAGGEGDAITQEVLRRRFGRALYMAGHQDEARAVWLERMVWADMPDPDDASDGALWAMELLNRAQTALGEGDPLLARAVADEAARRVALLAERYPNHPAPQEVAGVAQWILGRATEDPEEALAHYTLAAQRLDVLGQGEEGFVGIRLHRLDALSSKGRAELELERWSAAQDTFDEQLEVALELAELGDGDAQAQIHVAMALRWLGRSASLAGDAESAEDSMAEACERLLARYEQTSDPALAMHLAEAYAFFAAHYGRGGAGEAAEAGAACAVEARRWQGVAEQAGSLGTSLEQWFDTLLAPWSE